MFSNSTALRLLLSALPLIAACSKAGSKQAPAATVTAPVAESGLAAVTLTTSAYTHLRIGTGMVDSSTTTLTRTIGGELIVPPGRALVVAAPVAGRVLAPASGVVPTPGQRVRQGQALLRLAALPPDRDLLRTRQDLSATEARLTQAQLEADRTAALFRDRLVATRDQERAQADLAAAKAAFDAAASQEQVVTTGGVRAGSTALVISAPRDGILRTLAAGPGQVVAAGTVLAEVASLDELWVRVPVFAGDASAVQPQTEVQVHPLTGSDPAAAGWRARRVMAPPTSDPVTASVDLYFAIVGGSALLQPGQRVNVQLPLRATRTPTLSVPLASVVHDAYGGAWVYVRTDSLRFERRRIDILEVLGDRALLRRGPAAGTSVVTAGAAELFGVEFGAGK